jgi:hypothetical protein
MPYTPFTRDQRIVALDWARKLGANNVPTIESLDECERQQGPITGNTNDLDRHGAAFSCVCKEVYLTISKRMKAFDVHLACTHISLVAYLMRSMREFE